MQQELIFVDNHPYMLVDGNYLPAVFGGAEPEEPDQVAKVQEFIKGEVEKYHAELLAKQQPEQPQQQRSQQQQAQEDLRNLISPFVEPGINEAKFLAADTQDYVKFYTSNPEYAEYQEEVEKRFVALKNAGRATSRHDILKHMLGDDFIKDKDAFVTKASERKQKQLERAESASDVGYGSMTKAKNDPFFSKINDYGNLKGDDLSKAIKEMEKMMDGVTF